MIDLLALLEGVRRSGEGWTARCPAHDDKHNSLSVHHRNGRWLLKCHASCELAAIIQALGISAADLFDDHGQGGRNFVPSDNLTTVQPTAALSTDPCTTHSADEGTSVQAGEAGVTLEQYAAAKMLSIEFLKACGVSEVTLKGKRALRVSYLGKGGMELAVRFRVGMEGDRFRWKAGSKPCLYGLHRLAEVQKAGEVPLVEGESDCHTLWFHGIPALGIPGADNWREERDARHLDGIETIYIVIEPDRGGERIKKWLSRSSIRHRAKLVSLPAKDPSALHVQNPEEFKRRWHTACLGAVPWSAVEARAKEEKRNKAWERCHRLAREANLLDAFAIMLSRIGVVGERRAAKIIYLTLTSRLLDKPISLVIKGPSAAGKSFLADSVLRFFPPEAFYTRTAMSERALVYSNEPLKHRHIVLYEAAGMNSDFLTYLIRSLLSEGCIRYETVEKTKEGLVPRLIEREGPTGLIVTTTNLRLHPENETRMLSLTITDTQEQTAAIIRALADEKGHADVDLVEWQELQILLANGPNEVVIPFADRLAELVPPVAVRLRRDFKTILTMVRAHALLHQAARRRDAQGRIIAEIEDYKVVRELMADVVAVGVEVTVKREVREVVDAVALQIRKGKEEVRQADLRSALQLDKSAISRRVADAIDAGYLKNLEDRKRRPARLVLGDPLPEDLEVLPAPEQLGLHSCTLDGGETVTPATSSDRQSSTQPRKEATQNGTFASPQV